MDYYYYYLILTLYLCNSLVVVLGNGSFSIGSVVILNSRNNDVMRRIRPPMSSAARVRRKRFDCDCGEGSINCFDYEGRVACECHNNRYVIGGSCSDCKCHNGLCDIESGTCECWRGHGLIKGQNLLEHTCEVCNCGKESVPCRFVDGLQLCHCPGRFISVNATCTGCSCKADEMCLEIANRSACDCSNVFEDCEECDCLDDPGCSSSKSKKVCKCLPGKANLDGNCVECACKENAKCSFKNGSKACSCVDGFEENGDGNCERCFCGDGHSCSFENGASVCACKENHVEHNGICKNCTCNEGERCEFVDGKAKCVPKEISDFFVGTSCPGCTTLNGYFSGDGFGSGDGFASGEGSGDDSFCKDIDGKRICLCPENFADNGGTCEKCWCGENAHCRFENGKQVCSCNDDGHTWQDGKCYEACDSDLCFKGTCENDDGFSHCKCDEGFTGFHCDEEIIMTNGVILLIALLTAVTAFWMILIGIYIIRRKRRYRGKVKQSKEPFNQRNDVMLLNNLESRR